MNKSHAIAIAIQQPIPSPPRAIAAAHPLTHPTMRRQVWIGGIALFSASIWALAPKLDAAIIIAAMMSLTYALAANRNVAQLRENPQMYTLASAMLAATLLWVATGAGAHAAAFSAPEGAMLLPVLTVIFSTAAFVALVLVEFALSLCVQFILSRNANVATSIAVMIDVKYAGLFGKLT